MNFLYRHTAFLFHLRAIAITNYYALSFCLAVKVGLTWMQKCRSLPFLFHGVSKN